MVTTFERRMERRRRWGPVIALTGAALVGAFTYVLVFFALVVAIPLTYEQRSIIVSVVFSVVFVAYLGRWFTRGFHVENIDTQISDMGPISKKLLMGAIEEQLECDKEST